MTKKESIRVNGSTITIISADLPVSAVFSSSTSKGVPCPSSPVFEIMIEQGGCGERRVFRGFMVQSVSRARANQSAKRK